MSSSAETKQRVESWALSVEVRRNLVGFNNAHGHEFIEKKKKLEEYTRGFVSKLMDANRWRKESKLGRSTVSIEVDDKQVCDTFKSLVPSLPGEYPGFKFHLFTCPLSYSKCRLAASVEE